MSFDDVDYDTMADLLYSLAGQLLAHLRSYLPDEDAVRNVLMYRQRRLGDLVHAQMDQHRREHATGYEAKVTTGHRPLKPLMCLIPTPEVQAKARAASIWCQHATEFTRTTDGKPWRYLLIPDNAVKENMSLTALAALYERKL